MNFLLDVLYVKKGAHLTMGVGRRQARFDCSGVLKKLSELSGLKHPKPMGRFIQIGKQMSSKEQHEGGHNRRQNYHDDQTGIGRNTQYGKPLTEDGKGECQQMPKVQSSASPRLTGYVKKQGHSKGGKGYSERKEPFDPIFYDEIIALPHHFNGRSMLFLINHFWHGIQQDENEKKDSGSQKALVWVGLQPHFQKH